MRDDYGRPLLAPPYAPFGDPFADPLFAELRLRQFCMRAKGYELAPKDELF